MFTGIITATGVFQGYRRSRREILIEAPEAAAKLEPGDSLAVDGVCLSLVRRDGRGLVFGLSLETREKTTLGRLRTGARVNLELPLSPSSLLSGHLVSGHVDGVGQVVRLAARGPGKRLTVSYPRELAPFFVVKGSAAVNGVSLTVASLGAGTFDAEIIPLTLEATNLGRLKPGAPVNLECDMIGKYVYNSIVTGGKRPRP